MAADLAARGLEAVAAPMLSVVREPDVVGRILAAGAPRPDALAFTSAHGVAAVAADVRLADVLAIPAFAVGGATAEALAAAGFGDIRAGGGDGDALVGSLLGALPEDAVVVHVAGRDRAVAVAERLAAAGRRARTVVAYRAEPATRLEPAIAADLAAGRFDIAVVASRRTAETFRRMLQAEGLALPLERPLGLAISAGAAEPLRAALARVEVAGNTDGPALTEGVVALAAALANNGEERRG